ncbi:MAG: shikimate kinase [Candidatus Omnitrophota bacterium]|nr:shikimate kinase [Candidatus Omnitrophota bacterium]
MKIVLTGFMGAGKSATGKILARQLNLEFIDTDSIVEERAGQPIKEIFQLQGEPFFRSLEKKVVAEIARKDGVVIAVGGGAILDPENRRNLKKNGIVIFLMVSPDWVRKRVAGDGSRPLLNVPNNVGARLIAPAGRMNPTPTKKIIKNLLSQRLPLYRKADICVDTDGKTPRAVAQEIIEKLKL